MLVRYFPAIPGDIDRRPPDSPAFFWRGHHDIPGIHVVRQDCLPSETVRATGGDEHRRRVSLDVASKEDAEGRDPPDHVRHPCREFLVIVTSSACGQIEQVRPPPDLLSPGAGLDAVVVWPRRHARHHAGERRPTAKHFNAWPASGRGNRAEVFARAREGHRER